MRYVKLLRAWLRYRRHRTAENYLRYMVTKYGGTIMIWSEARAIDPGDTHDHHPR